MRSSTAWRASLVAFALGIALLAAGAWTAYTRLTELRDANAAVEHTLLVRAEAGGVLSLLKDAETGQRGFVIVGADDYLAPYSAALNALPGRVDQLRRLTADNAVQQKHVADLDDLITRRLDVLRGGIDARRRGGPEAAAAVVRDGEDKRLMDAAREVVDAITAEEDRLLVERQEVQAARARSATLVSVGGIVVAIGLLASATALMAVAVREGTLARAEQAAAETVSAATRQSEARLRATIASIGDGVITTDTRGRVTRLNAVAENLTGWTTAEAAGRPLDELFVIVNEDTRQSAENPAHRVLREGTVAGLANHTVLIARDGRETPIDDTAAPIKADDGEMLGVVLVFRDITERRRAERELAVVRERLAQIVESVPGIVWEAWGQPDTAGQRINFVSAYVEPMLGYSVEEWLATPNFWLTIVHPDDRDKAAGSAARAFAAREAHVNRFRWMRKDGRPVWVEAHSTVICDESGQAVGMRGVTFEVPPRAPADA